MSDKKYWVWLANVMGPGSRTDELFSVFKNPQEVYETDYAKRKLTGVFTLKQLERSKTFKLSDAENIISVCDKNGWGVVTPAMREYPAGLRRLIDFPLVLYLLILVLALRCLSSCMYPERNNRNTRYYPDFPN